MENRWLLTWLLAPFLSPAPLAIEACSLYWFLRQDDPTAELESSTLGMR
jgi:hypothetical protein